MTNFDQTKQRRSIGDIASALIKAKFVCDPLGTLTIIGYECGRMVNTAFYSLVSKGDDKQAQALFAKTELADLLTQLRIFCMQQGWDFEEVLAIGEDRVFDAIEKWQKRGLEPATNLWESIKGWAPYSEHALHPLVHNQTPRYTFSADGRMHPRREGD